MTKHLIIPDAHVSGTDSEGVILDDYSRFTALSDWIIDNRPDKIIFIGDFGDFESINHFDGPGSLAKEGLRLQDDIDAIGYAYGLIFERVEEQRIRDRRNSKKQYLPEVWFLEGNHEYRLRKLEEEKAIFEGLFDLQAELQSYYPHIWIPYGEYVDVDNILYTHIPFKNGGPIKSVVNTTGMALELVDKSVVFGHTHRWEVKQKRRAGSYDLITAISVGCFFPGIPPYAKADTPNWCKQIVWLDVYDNSFDIHTLGMERLIHDYS